MACLLRFEDTLGSEIVDFFIGPCREHFEVHEELICQNAPVFDKMFKSGSSKDLNKSVYLPEDDSSTFTTFIHWLYADELEEIEVDKKNPWQSEALLERIKLTLFAEMYCVDVLADYAVDTILLAHEMWGELDFTRPSLEVIQLVYDNTLPKSGLRLFLVKCSAISAKHSKPALSETDIQRYMMYTNSQSVLKSLKEYKNEVSNELADHPCAASICDYHKHQEELECFTRSRAEAVQEEL